MLYRAEPGTLLVFNRDLGITAALSGRELNIVKDWLHRERESTRTHEFIKRLQTLKLLPIRIGAEKQLLLRKIADTDVVTAPPGSFVAPESLHIDLTTKCPLSCKQCYKLASEFTIPLEKFSDIIAQAQRMGVFQIALGGGEPLMLDDLPRYVQMVSKAKMACTVTTSGWRLNIRQIKALQTAGLNHLQVSLNGSTRAIHERSRDGFAEAMQALKLLAENKLAFGINWVARQDNVADFANLVNLARMLKADNINILRYKPSFHEAYEANALPPHSFYTLAAAIKNSKGLRITLDSAFSNLICYLNPERANAFHCGCGAGRRFMVVDAEGRFKPCSHLNPSEESNGDLLDYWRYSPHLYSLRTLEKEIGGWCQGCRWLYCCGGCRAIAQKVFGNVAVGEVACPAYQK